MSIENKIKKNIDLAPLTTFKIGGKAKFFIEIREDKKLAEAVNWAKSKNEPIIILAGGSNILVSDNGINGLVIRLSGGSLSAKGNEIDADAGVSLARLVKLTGEKGLAGLEWAAGIPGTVGGAVRGNAGAFGSDMGKIVKSVKVYDRSSDSFSYLNNEKCGFVYRSSLFKQKDGLIIVKVILRLNKDKKSQVNKLINKCLKYRQDFQPKERSAGSVFKNLTVKDLEKYNIKLAALAKKSKGLVKGGKVGAGWLIDRLGVKGKSIGGAKISEKHGNFIINTGKSRATDVIGLIGFVKKLALDKYGIELEEEIQYFGF